MNPDRFRTVATALLALAAAACPPRTELRPAVPVMAGAAVPQGAADRHHASTTTLR